MARQVVEVTITAEGRDKDKTFVLTEMPASQAERWAARALLAIGKAVDLGEDVKEGGMAALAGVGLRALFSMSFAEADLLMAEMMTCVQIKPSDRVVRALVEDDIEEVMTRVQLRAEVFALHTGFFIPGFPSQSIRAAKPLF